MGTWNLLAWAWPFAFSPSVDSGLVYEHNEIDGKSSSNTLLRLRRPNH
jgi:palmitoyltransferase